MLAVAVNDVDDTRPVLDYYKREGGESNILETFKTYQTKILAEEEERRHQMESQRSRTGMGKISPFSLQRKKIQRPVSKYIIQRLDLNTFGTPI